MTLTLDKAATIAMLASLRDGDRPLNTGDVFHHPSHGPMRISRVAGWKDMMHFDGRSLKGVRAFAVTAVREGRKKAERVNFLLPKREATA